jgi:hypothetical protein
MLWQIALFGRRAKAVVASHGIETEEDLATSSNLNQLVVGSRAPAAVLCRSPNWDWDWDWDSILSDRRQPRMPTFP